MLFKCVCPLGSVLALNPSLSVGLGHAEVLARMDLPSSWIKCGQSGADDQASAHPQLILDGFNMSCGQANLCGCHGNDGNAQCAYALFLNHLFDISG